MELAFLARVHLHVIRVVSQTAAGLADENCLSIPMVLAFILGPAALFIRMLTGTAAQLALAVLAHFAGARLPLRIEQDVLVESATAEGLEALRALVLLILTFRLRRMPTLRAARAHEVSIGMAIMSNELRVPNARLEQVLARRAPVVACSQLAFPRALLAPFARVRSTWSSFFQRFFKISAVPLARCSVW
eukprot:8172657-Pyramimonas_sp.AAC.1